MRSIRFLAGAVLALGMLAALFFGLEGAAAQTETESRREAVQQAAGWLVLQHQNEDGGYTSFSSGAGEAPSDVGGTADAMLALSGAGYNVAAPHPEREASPIDFLQDDPAALAAYAAQGGGQTGKLILALAAAGQNPRTFAGHNFAISLTNHLSPTGQYNAVTPFEQSLAILAQTTVSGTVPPAATQWLLSRQAQEGDVAGSWDDGFGTQGNPDATAMAVMALVSAGEPVTGTALTAARDFLARAQLGSGGWSYGPDLPESANSTALALQALSALGEDFYSADGEWAVDGTTPLAALHAWQSDSGAFQADFGDGAVDDFLATVQALPALAGKPYPLPAPYEATRRALACLDALQDAESGGWEEFAGSGANAAGTSRAIQALAAAGADVNAPRWRADGTSPLQALAQLAPAYLAQGRGGRVGIVMQGVSAAGGDATDFAGFNLPISATHYLSPTGEYADTSFGAFSHAEAMLGLMAAGRAPDPAAVEWLLGAQAEDGGWGGADTTGISLQVLGRLQDLPSEAVIPGALDNLRQTQLADGGWGMELPSNPNSSSEVAQGLVAVGENPFAPGWSRVLSGTLRNAADVVLAQQSADGCWPNRFGPGADPFGTTDAILLLQLNPPWGASFATAQEEPTVQETTPAEEPTATMEPEATATAAPTDEPTVEPTEIPATETPVPTETPAASAPVEASPTAQGGPAGAAGGQGNVLVWVAVILVLALVAGLGLRYMRPRG